MISILQIANTQSYRRHTKTQKHKSTLVTQCWWRQEGRAKEMEIRSDWYRWSSMPITHSLRISTWWCSSQKVETQVSSSHDGSQPLNGIGDAQVFMRPIWSYNWIHTLGNIYNQSFKSNLKSSFKRLIKFYVLDFADFNWEYLLRNLMFIFICFIYDHDIDCLMIVVVLTTTTFHIGDHTLWLFLLIYFQQPNMMVAR